MKLHIGDSVVVISGKDKGKQGTILRVLETQNRVVVESINMRTKHIKKTQNQAGSRVSYEASIHASNVMVLDPKTKKPTRIGYKIDPKTGKKTRVAMLSGEMITKSATTKALKKEKKESKSEKTEKEPSPQPATTPAKTPFWKRGGKNDGDKKGGGSSGTDGGSNVIQTAHRAQGG